MYKVIIIYPDGEREELDEVFSSRADAEYAGQYNCDCYSQGNEIMNLSNPGDYPLDNEEAEYEVIEC